MNTINIGYIYLLREREFIKSSENIYKIGYTNQIPNKRFNGYPRDSELLLLEKINSANEYEKILLKIFKQEFINRKDIGHEYFEGNKNYMCNIILKTCNIKQQTDLKKYNISRFKINDSKPFETKKKYYSYNKDELYRRNRVKESKIFKK